MSEKEQLTIFDQWLGQYKGLIFKIIRAYAFDQDDRDDLFQEVALQIWRSIPNFRSESQVSTWLYRVVLNTAINWKGKEARERQARQGDQPVTVLVEEDHVRIERIEWLYAEIAKLNEIDRSLCLMLLDDLSYKQMSEVLGITEGNVAIKIHRLKKKLTESKPVVV